MAYKKQKKKVNKATVNDGSKSCFSYVNGKVKDAQSNTDAWAIAQEKWYKLRARIKKTKTFPFVGSSNLRMPTAETKIRKLKAAIMQAIYGIRPIVQAIPQPGADPRTAIKVEKFIDHLVMDIIGMYNKSIILIDQTLEKGFYLGKPYWKTEVTQQVETVKLEDLDEQETLALNDPNIPIEQMIEYLLNKLEVDQSKLVLSDNIEAATKIVQGLQNGAKEVSATFQDVQYDFPDVSLVDPERCYVNTDAGFDPQSTDFIDHEFFMSIDLLKSKTRKNGWDVEEIQDIFNMSATYQTETSGGRTGASGENNLTDEQKDAREGIDRLQNANVVKVWEYYGWYDIDGDGVPENCVITALPEFSKIVRKVRLPFDSGKKPFVKFMYELTDDRWFSHRGIPEILEDIIKEIDVQHNQKIDDQTIRNAPMFKYRPGMVNPNMVKFIPGQGIPVNGMNPLDDSIKMMQNTNQAAAFSYEKEQMLLESKTDELIGQVDYTLQSMINKRQPRTLGEVELQNQNMQQIFSLDAGLFANQFSELFNWIWDLWCQYGSDEYEFSYFGEKGWEPIKLTKEEIQGKYKIVVRGNDNNTNPQVRMGKAQQVLMATTDQTYIQAGVVTPKEMKAGLEMFYQYLDVPNWETLVNQEETPPPQPPDPKIAIEPKFEDLAEGEQAQVLQAFQIQPDGMGRSLKKREEDQDRTMDLLDRLGGSSGQGSNNAR